MLAAAYAGGTLEVSLGRVLFTTDIGELDLVRRRPPLPTGASNRHGAQAT